VNHVRPVSFSLNFHSLLRISAICSSCIDQFQNGRLGRHVWPSTAHDFWHARLRRRRLRHGVCDVVWQHDSISCARWHRVVCIDGWHPTLSCPTSPAWRAITAPSCSAFSRRFLASPLSPVLLLAASWPRRMVRVPRFTSLASVPRSARSATRFCPRPSPIRGRSRSSSGATVRRTTDAVEQPPIVPTAAATPNITTVVDNPKGAAAGDDARPRAASVACPRSLPPPPPPLRPSAIPTPPTDRQAGRDDVASAARRPDAAVAARGGVGDVRVLQRADCRAAAASGERVSYVCWRYWARFFDCVGPERLWRRRWRLGGGSIRPQGRDCVVVDAGGGVGVPVDAARDAGALYVS
jgi:hypothetical protein